MTLGNAISPPSKAVYSPPPRLSQGSSSESTGTPGSSRPLSPEPTATPESSHPPSPESTDESPSGSRPASSSESTGTPHIDHQEVRKTVIFGEAEVEEYEPDRQIWDLSNVLGDDNFIKIKTNATQKELPYTKEIHKLSVYISSLRKKLEPNSDFIKFIQNKAYEFIEKNDPKTGKNLKSLAHLNCDLFNVLGCEKFIQIMNDNPKQALQYKKKIHNLSKLIDDFKKVFGKKSDMIVKIQSKASEIINNGDQTTQFESLYQDYKTILNTQLSTEECIHNIQALIIKNISKHKPMPALLITEPPALFYKKILTQEFLTDLFNNFRVKFPKDSNEKSINRVSNYFNNWPESAKEILQTNLTSLGSHSDEHPSSQDDLDAEIQELFSAPPSPTPSCKSSCGQGFPQLIICC
jgi:hypothetical protein